MAWDAPGGTLIGLDGAVAYLADPKTGLLAISRENQPREDKEAGAAARPEAGEAGKPEAGVASKPETRVPGKLLATEEAYQTAIQPKKELPDEVPGVLLKARLDPDHWITAGLGETVNVLYRGRSVYTPIKLDKGVNAAVFLGPEQILASGHLWEENRKQLAYKPFVVVQPSGRGMVIGFTADPNFRAYVDGLNVLFLNAIFRSQARLRTADQKGGW